MRTIHVEVTEEDKRCGIRGDCQACAAARALGRAGAPAPSLDTFEAIWDVRLPPDEWVTAKVPTEVAEWIEAFDDGKFPDPIAFDLEFEGLT